MEGGISVTDILHEKVEQMNEEVKRLSQVLQAKEAVLEDVICAINQLPRHPNNTAVIRVSILLVGCEKAWCLCK